MIVTDPKALDTLLASVCPSMAIDTETVGKLVPKRATHATDALVLDRAEIVMATVFSYSDTGPVSLCIPLRNHYGPKYMSKTQFVEVISPYCADSRCLKIFHNANYDINVLMNAGVSRVKEWYCTSIASSMQNENLPCDLKSRATIVGMIQKKYKNVDLTNMEEFSVYAEQDAEITYKLWLAYTGISIGFSGDGSAGAGPKAQIGFGREWIICEENRKLMERIEFPVLDCVIKMERVGMLIDIRKMEKIHKLICAETEDFEKVVYKEAGQVFNIRSTKQMQKVLYGDLGVTPPEDAKTKTGFSVGMPVLQEMLGQHPIIEALLEYNRRTKLCQMTSDAKGLQSYADTKGFIHSTLRTTGARTSRLSSSNPNLQNVPNKTDTYGIRECFISPAGYSFLAADYSGMELVGIANISGDKFMQGILRSRGDLHQATADKMSRNLFGKDGKISRSMGKTFNFAIFYGISAFKLSKVLTAAGKPTSKQQAMSYIEAFFDTYHEVKQYIDNLMLEYDSTGHVIYMSGRRRTIPMMSKASRSLRHRGERQLFNTVVQGFCADILKDRIIRLCQDSRLLRWGCYPVSTVHDEIIFYVKDRPSFNHRRCLKRVTEIMEENIYNLPVPFFVDAKIGQNWEEAK